MCALADQISFTLIEKPQRYCNIGDLFRKLHLRSWSGAIDSLVMYFGVNLRNLWVLFVVPACHLLALDRFDWHHQASVNCSKQGCQEISATSNYFFRDSQKNFWDCGESNLGPLGGKCECYPLCYAAPPPPHLWVLFCCRDELPTCGIGQCESPSDVTSSLEFFKHVLHFRAIQLIGTPPRLGFNLNGTL